MPIPTERTSATRASSSVAGMRLRIRSIAGTPCTKERPRSPVSADFTNRPELHPQRLVEAEPFDRLLALDLVGLGADQDVDRIAERVDADEHQRRHHGDDQQALPEPPEQEGEHGLLSPGGAAGANLTVRARTAPRVPPLPACGERSIAERRLRRDGGRVRGTHRAPSISRVPLTRLAARAAP